MAPENFDAAYQAAEKLSTLDQETLLRQLGLRIEDAKEAGGEVRKEKFEAKFVDTSETQGWDALEEVGRRWYQKAEAELMNLLCAKDSADRDQLTKGKSIPGIAASLATAGLFTLIAAPPAWAIVAATLLAQKITQTGLDALCEVYYERKGKGKH